jgi:hypothetical protein
MMGRSGRITTGVFVLFMAAQLACAMTSTGDPTWPPATIPSTDAPESVLSDADLESADEAAIPPIYVTVALHIEDVPVYANCDAFPDFRQKLLDFAQAMAPYQIPINLQTDYEFLMGVERCETPAVQAETDGQNVLDYLASEYGYEIDPHQEGGWDIEGQDNYADIRYLAGQLTSATSQTIGGLVWDDPAQWRALAQGQAGLQNPGYTWNPVVLTLAVGSQHHMGDFSDDDYASGVWRPAGAGEKFWDHDPDGAIIYIGPGEYTNWGNRSGRRSTLEFVRHLLAGLETGELDRDVIYTATLAVPQSIVFDANEHFKLQQMLDELAPLAESGQIIFVTYSQVVQIWASQYAANPNIYIQP